MTEILLKFIIAGDSSSDALSKARRLLKVDFKAEEIQLLTMENYSTADADFCLDRSFVCRPLLRGTRAGGAAQIYAEPTLVSTDHAAARCCDGEALLSGSLPPDALPAENDPWLEKHRYYIRFSGDSRGWLELVTAEHLENAVITRPITVKAAHGWAENARACDPSVFVAGILE